MTVVVPTFNRAHFLGDALDSVMNQTFPHWRLLVVDDASSDPTRKLLRPYLKDPRIKLLRLPRNGGPARALNAALARVTTPFMLHLDSDDWLEPECLNVFLSVARRLPAWVALFYGFYWMWLETGAGSERRLKGSPVYRSPYDVVRNWGGACPRFFRVGALCEVGGWDVDVLFEGRVCEDFNVVSRMVARYGLCCVGFMTFNYRRHPGAESRRYRAQRRFIRQLTRRRLREWGGAYLPRFQPATAPGSLDRIRLVPTCREVPQQPRSWPVHEVRRRVDTRSGPQRVTCWYAGPGSPGAGTVPLTFRYTGR